MASTRLVRKALRNRTVSKQRVNKIKRLASSPVIKKVDIEQIKAEFASKKAKLAIKKENPVEEVPKVVEPAKAKVATPEVKEEKKAAPKKVTAKKTASKEKKGTKKEDSKTAE